MKKFMNIVKSAIIDGFFTILPILLIFLILYETYTLIYEVVEPLAHKMPGKELLGIGASSWLVLVIIIILFMIVGLFVKTSAGKKIGYWVDANIMSHVPGYQLLSSVSKQFSGKGEEMLLSPAIFNTAAGIYTIAFILDEHDNGFYSLFVPMAPTPMMGTVQYAEKSRVRRLENPPAQVIDTLMKWGIGSKDLFNLTDFIEKQTDQTGRS